MQFWDNLDKHYGDVYRFAYRMVGESSIAEDIVQESFLRMARNQAKNLEGESARKWLFVVARNLCVSHLRRSVRHRKVSIDVCPHIRSAEPDPGQSMCANDRSRLVAEAVSELPSDMREVVILREYEGMDYAQVAEVVGCAVGTVRSRLARARDRLRVSLQSVWEGDR